MLLTKEREMIMAICVALRGVLLRGRVSSNLSVNKDYALSYSSSSQLSSEASSSPSSTTYGSRRSLISSIVISPPW